MNQEIKKRVILCVDDNPTNLRILDETLRSEYKIHTAPSGEWAMAFLQKKVPDLILLDVRMEGMTGHDFIKQVKNTPILEDIPIIFLTASEGMEDEVMAFQAGAVDYIRKPIVPTLVLARVMIHLELAVYRKSLEELVVERTKKLEKAQDSILSLLANVSSYRDEETGAHIRRTTEYAAVLVRALRSANKQGYLLSETYGEDIIKSAKLHDIGKVAVPDAILLKPGKLTEEEFETMKLHTVYGASMIDDAIQDLQDASFLSVAHEIIIGHHEKWNGRGYPNGLAGEDIPLSARIMAIADVYDALISRRPYKEPFTHERALEIIFKDSGTHFDPNILEIAKDEIHKFDAIAKTFLG